jgi:hypothetical protein
MEDKEREGHEEGRLLNWTHLFFGQYGQTSSTTFRGVSTINSNQMIMTKAKHCN